MRVRIRLHPNELWIVESKRWYDFEWNYENSFIGDNAYERAHFFARLLKNPEIEEIKKKPKTEDIYERTHQSNSIYY